MLTGLLDAGTTPGLHDQPASPVGAVMDRIVDRYGSTAIGYDHIGLRTPPLRAPCTDRCNLRGTPLAEHTYRPRAERLSRLACLGVCRSGMYKYMYIYMRRRW